MKSSLRAGQLCTASARTKIKRPEGSTVTATIGIGPRSEGGFGITAELDVYLPELPEAEAKSLVKATHEICPYSNAIKASVDVKIRIRP
jgi:lipoyl-dependent peroxiredoxin